MMMIKQKLVEMCDCDDPDKYTSTTIMVVLIVNSFRSFEFMKYSISLL